MSAGSSTVSVAGLAFAPSASSLPSAFAAPTSGDKTQSRNTIVVYFTEGVEMAMLPGAQTDSSGTVRGNLNPSYFTLIETDDTANPNDDTWIMPTTVAYTYNKIEGINQAVLTFGDADGNVQETYFNTTTQSWSTQQVNINAPAPSGSTPSQIPDLSQFGTGSLRLQVGSQYQVPNTFALNANNSGSNTSSFGTADNLTTDLQQLDPADGGNLGGGANLNPASIVISGAITPQPYDIEYPGDVTQPGSRNLPPSIGLDGQSDYGAGTTPDTGPTGAVTTYTYYFPQTYEGTGGTTLTNGITAAQGECRAADLRVVCLLLRGPVPGVPAAEGNRYA